MSRRVCACPPVPVSRIREYFVRYPPTGVLIYPEIRSPRCQRIFMYIHTPTHTYAYTYANSSAERVICAPTRVSSSVIYHVDGSVGLSPDPDTSSSSSSRERISVSIWFLSENRISFEFIHYSATPRDSFVRLAGDIP